MRRAQVLLNWQRGSTQGWDVRQVQLDLLGGLLSLLQLGLEAALLRDPGLVTGNPIKLLLALISLAYDCVLIGQHVAYDGPRFSRLPKQASSEQEQGGAGLDVQ